MRFLKKLFTPKPKQVPSHLALDRQSLDIIKQRLSLLHELHGRDIYHALDEETRARLLSRRNANGCEDK